MPNTSLSAAVLLERSKDQLDSVGCYKLDDPLVALKCSDRLLVEPIWEKPINGLEGPLYQDYITDNPAYNSVYVRAPIAERLLQATKKLPNDFRLIVRAGHRPKAVQIKLLDSLIRLHMQQHPDVSREQAVIFARTFVSDPSIKSPPHCCGAAVDVDVMNTRTNTLVDFGCPVNTDSDISFLHTSNINVTQRKNRLILLQAMLSAGFASYYAEWWHFLYGDQIWAQFYHQPAALYDLIEPIF